VGWTVNTAANGMIVNGSNVEATGLFVEHYQQTEVASNVTSFGGWGLGSYCYFNVNPAVNSYNAFESPSPSFRRS
jgi:hypothetical protein